MAKRGKLRGNIVPLLTLLLVIVISLSFFLYGRDPETIAGLRNYGYLGAFLLSLIGNATVLVLPLAVLPVLSAIGTVLYPTAGAAGPVIVALVGGVGACIGELSGYMLGYSGRAVVRNNKLYLKLVGWAKSWGTLGVFIFALFPFFFDLAGMAAGVLRLPLWKFILACWFGRTLNYLVFVWLVSVWGWEIMLHYFG